MTREVIARPAPGTAVDEEYFADVTSRNVESIEWMPASLLRVTFAGPISDAAAAKVARRIVSASPEEEALRARLAGFLAAPPEDLAGWLADVTALLLSIGTGQPPIVVGEDESETL